MGDATDPSKSGSKPTIYFGYGSNLWRHQMALRCPTSQYLGVGRLDGWKWIINERGYADVVEVRGSNSSSNDNDGKGYTDYSNSVFGLVFTLKEADERRLDRNEGVPIAYTKEYHSIKLWEPSSNSSSEWVDVTEPPTRTVPMLVYVDRIRTGKAKPKTEYVYRMNMGIRDALDLGVPKEYVGSVMRKFIPKETRENDPEEEREGKDKALRQAGRFVDESGVFERVD
jgi:cation transport regulator ChaC